LTCLPSPPLALNCSQPSLSAPVFALVFGWMPLSPYWPLVNIIERKKERKKEKKKKKKMTSLYRGALFP
jgi:hypothetical protein